MYRLSPYATEPKQKPPDAAGSLSSASADCLTAGHEPQEQLITGTSRLRLTSHHIQF